MKDDRIKEIHYYINRINRIYEDNCRPYRLSNDIDVYNNGNKWVINIYVLPKHMSIFKTTGTWNRVIEKILVLLEKELEHEKQYYAYGDGC